MEPEKCEGWEWKGWDDMRDLVRTGGTQVFLPVANLLRDNPQIHVLVSGD